MQPFKIPDDFVCQKVTLTWRDIEFGLRHQLITPLTAINKATHSISDPRNSNPAEVDLAGRTESEPVMELVERLAAEESGSVVAMDKWLYLVLAWLFETQTSFVDSLQMVEEVYADFDYPSEVAPFVRYMPSDGPDLGSPELSRQRLHDRWKAYLDAIGKRFSPA